MRYATGSAQLGKTVSGRFTVYGEREPISEKLTSANDSSWPFSSLFLAIFLALRFSTSRNNPDKILRAWAIIPLRCCERTRRAVSSEKISSASARFSLIMTEPVVSNKRDITAFAGDSLLAFDFGACSADVDVTAAGKERNEQVSDQEEQANRERLVKRTGTDRQRERLRPIVAQDPKKSARC